MAEFSVPPPANKKSRYPLLFCHIYTQPQSSSWRFINYVRSFSAVPQLPLPCHWFSTAIHWYDSCTMTTPSVLPRAYTAPATATTNSSLTLDGATPGHWAHESLAAWAVSSPCRTAVSRSQSRRRATPEWRLASRPKTRTRWGPLSRSKQEHVTSHMALRISAVTVSTMGNELRCGMGPVARKMAPQGWNSLPNAHVRRSDGSVLTLRRALIRSMISALSSDGSSCTCGNKSMYLRIRGLEPQWRCEQVQPRRSEWPTMFGCGGAGATAATFPGAACTIGRSVSSDVEEISMKSGPDSASRKFAITVGVECRDVRAVLLACWVSSVRSRILPVSMDQSGANSVTWKGTASGKSWPHKSLIERVVLSGSA